MLYDAVAQRTLRHLGQPELSDAIAGGVKRPLGDLWAWSRKSSAVDISPLVAATLALWGASTVPDREPQVINLNEVLLDDDADSDDAKWFEWWHNAPDDEPCPIFSPSEDPHRETAP
jgi:hypothetical protein